MLQPQPSWNVIDSSKLSDYLRCPRYFFYSHILGWKLDYPAHDLFFGECWHRAREYQLINGYDELEGAMQTFLTCYREQFDESTDEYFRPKTPDAVWQALSNFSLTYPHDLEDNKLLRNPETNEPFTEISGTVPIDEKRVLYFRMDSLLERKKDGKVFSWDHKTTSANYIGKPNWDKQFYLSIQNGTYTHCLYCLYPVEQVLGVEFCGTGFGYRSRKDEYYSVLRRVPAFKSPDQMNVWLYTVTRLYDDIEEELDHLMSCREDDTIMEAFPLNPSSCTKYRGCEYHDFCMAWPNPLSRCQEPPIGFAVKFWDPRDKDSRNKMKLEWR